MKKSLKMGLFSMALIPCVAFGFAGCAGGEQLISSKDFTQKVSEVSRTYFGSEAFESYGDRTVNYSGSEVEAYASEFTYKKNASDTQTVTEYLTQSYENVGEMIISRSGKGENTKFKIVNNFTTLSSEYSVNLDETLKQTITKEEAVTTYYIGMVSSVPAGASEAVKTYYIVKEYSVVKTVDGVKGEPVVTKNYETLADANAFKEVIEDLSLQLNSSLDASYFTVGNSMLSVLSPVYTKNGDEYKISVEINNASNEISSSDSYHNFMSSKVDISFKGDKLGKVEASSKMKGFGLMGDEGEAQFTMDTEIDVEYSADEIVIPAVTDYVESSIDTSDLIDFQVNISMM